MCALVKSEERVWTEKERTGDTRPNSQDITKTAVSNQLQLAACVSHQTIINAGLIRKTQIQVKTFSVKCLNLK